MIRWKGTILMDDAVLTASQEMGHVLKSLLDVVRWPEAIAAVALVVQALILLQQRRILSGYGETLQRQAETAKLIGHALEQHGRILADHTRIMDEQFKVQRKIEAKLERSTVTTADADKDSSLVVSSQG
jgi:hypothetical protein